MAMSAEGCAAAIADAIGCEDAATKAQMKSIWTKILTKVFAEICKADVTVAAGIHVSTTGTAAAQQGATDAEGTATITG